MTVDNKKLYIGTFILLAYISIGIFGLFQFRHLSETKMDNCPYAQNEYALCKTNLDHINNWRQFSNTTFSSLFLLFILGIILHFFNQRKFLNKKHYFYKWKYYLYNKKLNIYPNRIIKWLSLLENSPSFLLKA